MSALQGSVQNKGVPVCLKIAWACACGNLTPTAWSSVKANLSNFSARSVPHYRQSNKQRLLGVNKTISFDIY